MKSIWQRKRPLKNQIDGWIEIPPGRASTSSFPLMRSSVTHFKNVFLQENEASCVVTSLANALIYINDKEGANELMKHKNKCLATTRRLQFAADILSQKRHLSACLQRSWKEFGNTTVCICLLHYQPNCYQKYLTIFGYLHGKLCLQQNQRIGCRVEQVKFFSG